MQSKPLHLFLDVLSYIFLMTYNVDVVFRRTALLWRTCLKLAFWSLTWSNTGASDWPPTLPSLYWGLTRCVHKYTQKHSKAAARKELFYVQLPILLVLKDKDSIILCFSSTNFMKRPERQCVSQLPCPVCGINLSFSSVLSGEVISCWATNRS